MATAASPLLARLATAAGTSKRLRFDAFQDIVLNDPEHGYFSTTAERAGRAGDFITAPETSPLFAHTLANALIGDANALDADAFHIVEVGAGKATLALGLFEGFQEAGLADRVRLHLVERSAAARATWPQRLRAIPDAIVRAYPSVDALPSEGWEAGAIVANELFDNLPVRRVMQTHTLHEIVLRVRPSGVREELVPAPPELGAYLEAQRIRLVTGQTAEICLLAPRLLAQLVARFRRGSAILIDYGDDAEHLYHPERFPHGSLAANRGHATHTDFYRDLGRQDLTAHVNFTPLRDTLEAAGWRQRFWGTQTRFLIDHGFAQLLERALASTQDEFEALRLRQRAKQLYHPDAMGEGFRVLHASSARTASHAPSQRSAASP